MLGLVGAAVVRGRRLLVHVGLGVCERAGLWGGSLAIDQPSDANDRSGPESPKVAHHLRKVGFEQSMRRPSDPNLLSWSNPIVLLSPWSVISYEEPALGSRIAGDASKWRFAIGASNSSRRLVPVETSKQFGRPIPPTDSAIKFGTRRRRIDAERCRLAGRSSWTGCPICEAMRQLLQVGTNNPGFWPGSSAERSNRHGLSSRARISGHHERVE